MQTDFTLAPGATPLEIARKRKLAEALLREGSDTSPVRHWAQGAARLAQALRGVQEDWGADAEQRKYDAYGSGLGNELDGMPAGASGLASALAGPSAAKTPSFVASGGAMAPADLLPHFEAASKATGIPAALLMAQAKQESGFNPNAVGKAGEVGLTQILPSTARQPGFGVQPVEPMELRDPARNIAFGAQYLAARGKAAGVQDWNDPTQAAKGLKAYNGGGDPNYVANVTRNLSGGAGQATMVGGDTLTQSGPSPQRLMAIATDPNAPPQIRERARMMYQEAQRNTGPEAELRRLQIDKARRDLAMPVKEDSPTVQRIKQPDGSEVAVQWDQQSRKWVPLAAPEGGNPVQNKTAAETAARKVEAEKLGLDTNDDRVKNYILTGQMPREPALTSTDKNAILEADEMVSGNRNTIAALKRAKEVSPKAMGFTGASALATVTSPFSETSQATVEMNQIVTEQALAGMKSIFGGNPTEGERKILLDIQGSASQPDAVRQKIFDRAIEAANRRLTFNEQKAKQLRGGDYYKPQSAPAQPAAPDPLGIR